jgi:hypothetical protein
MLHFSRGRVALRGGMNDIWLAEWTGLLDRIKTRFGDADLDEVDQEIRPVLLELARIRDDIPPQQIESEAS